MPVSSYTAIVEREGNGFVSLFAVELSLECADPAEVTRRERRVSHALSAVIP
jgi:hypothetical protein